MNVKYAASEQHNNWEDARNWIHLILSMVLLGFAVVLTSSNATFEASKSWGQFEQFDPNEMHWGLTYLVLCFIGFIGLVTPNKWINLISTFVLATVHAIMGMMFCMPWALGKSPPNPGMWTYTCLGILGYFLLWRRAKYAINPSKAHSAIPPPAA